MCNVFGRVAAPCCMQCSSLQHPRTNLTFYLPLDENKKGTFSKQNICQCDNCCICCINLALSLHICIPLILLNWKKTKTEFFRLWLYKVTLERLKPDLDTFIAINSGRTDRHRLWHLELLSSLEDRTHMAADETRRSILGSDCMTLNWRDQVKDWIIHPAVILKSSWLHAEVILMSSWRNL